MAGMSAGVALRTRKLCEVFKEQFQPVPSEKPTVNSQKPTF